MSAPPAAPTPGRVTRARSRTPLPALGAKQTNAYGAKGKSALYSQVQAGQDDLAAAFAGRRSMATGGASTAPSASARSGSEEPGPVPPVPIQRTAMESIAAYRGGMAANPEPEIARSRLVSNNTIARLLFWLPILLALVSGFLSSAVPLPSFRLEAGRYNILSGFRMIFHAIPYNVPPADLADRWFRFQHDQIFLELLPDVNLPEIQWAININFLTRLQRLEQRVASLETEIHLTNDTLAEIHQLLPVSIMLRQIDGKFAVPDDFWSALQERMVENTEMAPRWQAFVLRNEGAIMQLQQAQVDVTVNRAIEDGHLVTREIFMQAIKENNDWLATEYSQELHKMWHHNFENIKTLTENTATEIMDRTGITHFTKMQIDFLEEANLMHNTKEALRSVNYFSTAAGARIDPRITSPTVRTNYPFGILNTITKYFQSSMRSLPPIEALTDWNEATQCWCGTPTEKANGGVNIGVLTHHRVHPEHLVIEHIPAAATLDIAAAPRYFTVWADAGSTKAAKKYEHLIRETVPTLRYPNIKPKPMDRFVCIGIGEYRIHDSNHVQSYKLWDTMQEHAFATDRVIVRVEENWGAANHTCLYRLRLTGRKA